MAKKKKLFTKKCLIIAAIIIAIGVGLYYYYAPIRNFTFSTGEMLP